MYSPVERGRHSMEKSSGAGIILAPAHTRISAPRGVFTSTLLWGATTAEEGRAAARLLAGERHAGGQRAMATKPE